jgi:hypothetical protein
MVGDTPIVITGGSVNLEYADKPDDGFNPVSSGSGIVRFQHKKNVGDKVELSYVEIVDGAGNILFNVNLFNLGKHKDCKIKVYYDIKP